MPVSGGEKSRKTRIFAAEFVHNLRTYCSAKSTESDSRVTVTRIPVHVSSSGYSQNLSRQQTAHGATGGSDQDNRKTEKRESSAHFGAVRPHSHRCAILATTAPRWQQVAWRRRTMELRQGREQAQPQFASIGPAGEGAAAGDTSASDSALADGDAPAAGDGTAGAAAEVA